MLTFDLPPGHGSSEPISSAQAFSQADKDWSGDLSGDQIAAAVELAVSPHRRQHLKITADNSKELLLKFDLNKNGKIEQEEFFRFVQWVVAKEVMEYFSPGESKEKGKEALAHVMTDMFRCFDEDEDGFVECIEFLKGLDKICDFIEGYKASLSVKERKTVVQWFKAIDGIEGEGMDLYMSLELFKAHIPQLICNTLLTKSEFLDEKTRTFDANLSPGVLADFLHSRFVDKWLHERFLGCK